MALRAAEDVDEKRNDPLDGASAIVRVPATPVPYAPAPFDPMPMAPRRSPWAVLTPRDLLRFAAIAVLLTLVPAILAALISATGRDIYGAQVEVLYEAAPAATSPAQIDREFATQEVIVRSRSVLSPVAQKARMSVEDLEDAIDVDVVPGTQVLQIVVADPDAARAEELAQAVAETYIGLAITQATRQGARTSKGDEERLAALTTELSDLEAEAARAASRGQVQRETQFRTDAADVLRQIGALRDRLNLLPGSSLKGTPRVFVAAHILPDPLAPQPLRAAAAGAVLGALVATGTVLWLRRRTLP